MTRKSTEGMPGLVCYKDLSYCNLNKVAYIWLSADKHPSTGWTEKHVTLQNSTLT